MESTIIIKIYPNKETSHELNKCLGFKEINDSINSVKDNLIFDDSKYLIFITLNNNIIRYYIYNSEIDDLYLYVNLIEIPDYEVRCIIYKYLLDYEYLDYSPIIEQQHQQIQQLIDEGKIEEKTILNEIAKSAYSWLKKLVNKVKAKSIEEFNKTFGDFSFIEFLSKLFNLYGIDLNEEYEKFLYVYDLVNNNIDNINSNKNNKFNNKFYGENDFEFYFEINENQGQPDLLKIREKQEIYKRVLESQKERLQK